jgi:cell wall-associated NlpC family hydrolase
MVSSQLHRQISEAEDENVGVESAHRLEQTAEGGAYLAAHSHRARQLRQYRAAERAEVDALYRQSLRDHPELGSNPLSRWQQKQAIKRQYAEARRASQKAEGTFKTTAERISDTLRGAAEQSRKAGEFIVRHKRGFLIVLALFFMVVLLLNTMSSCSVLAEALLGAGGGSTYPSRDEDMLGAEASYAALEAGLQYEVDHYAELHPGYDEYRFDLDEIKHDPYVLISFLTAYHQGEWTLSEVQSTLQMLFDRQYTLAQTVTVEVRYRPETRTGPDGPYTVQVPYNYYICNVKLTNADLSHLPVEFLDEDKLHMYATYMATYGNRPDLFPTGEYPNASEREDYMDYDVPPEVLEDGTFAAMLAEAEKYLGYPYVWGGKNPTTSFDCSGFVSWVINHSGWNVGSRGVMGLEDICTPVSAANAKPGDLVFFINTYDAPYPDRPTHVGIYIHQPVQHRGEPGARILLQLRHTRCGRRLACGPMGRIHACLLDMPHQVRHRAVDIQGNCRDKGAEALFPHKCRHIPAHTLPRCRHAMVYPHGVTPRHRDACRQCAAHAVFHPLLLLHGRIRICRRSHLRQIHRSRRAHPTAPKHRCAVPMGSRTRRGIHRHLRRGR